MFRRSTLALLLGAAYLAAALLPCPGGSGRRPEAAERRADVIAAAQPGGAAHSLPAHSAAAPAHAHHTGHASHAGATGHAGQGEASPRAGHAAAGGRAGAAAGAEPAAAEPPASLSAPCPCGCGGGDAGTPAGRSGLAKILLPSAPSVAGELAASVPALAPSATVAAPARAIDHVPIPV